MSEPLTITVEFASYNRTKDNKYLGEEKFSNTRLSQLAHSIATHLLPLERNNTGVVFEIISYRHNDVVFTSHHKRELDGITEIFKLLVQQILKRT